MSLQLNSAIAFASIGAEIYHLVEPICPDEANGPGYGQLYIFCSSETRTVGLENQSNKGCMATE
jgi:hypothetical protein